MTEIFSNISDKVKRTAEFIWKVTLTYDNPLDAANFLHQMTEYYRKIYTDEEMDFLQFYFQMQMEMNKHD